jgi:pimeloyl-ACP methyl ester carboxylesterase
MSTKERQQFAREFPHAVKTLSTVEGPIEYVEMGSGKQATLVFVHGSPGGWHAFVDVLREKEIQKTYTMVAVDRPGYGGSSAGQPERSLAKQAARIMAVVKKVRATAPVILIGHSYGGPVIAKMAKSSPELIDGLVLVAASVDPDLEKTKWFQLVANWRVFRWLLPDMLDVCNQEILALKSELEAFKKYWQQIKIPTAIVHG